MKKLISLISALAIAASLVCPAYAAETEESGIYSQEFTTTIATAKDFDLSQYNFTGDTVVEVEYDFSNSPMYKTTPATEEGGTETTADLNLNIPFVFKTGNNEVIRFSINGDGTAAKNVKLHRTKFDYIDSDGTNYVSGSTLSTRSGFVARKGKLTFLFSQTDKRLYAQYTGDGIKTAGYMGWAPFTYVETKDEETETTTYSQIDTTAGLTKLTVGASGAPVVDLKIKAYSVSEAEAAAIKKPYAKYTYESDYTGAVSGLYAASGIEQPMDFKVNTGVSIEKDTESDNHYAKVSSTGEYKVMLAPQYRGIEDYTDYTFIKYKQYIPVWTTTTAGTKKVQTGAYEANSKTELSITAADTLKFKGNTYTLPESMVGKWTEIMFVYCPSAGTVSMYADGKRYATETYSIDNLNTIFFMFDNDTYIDDLEMGEYIPTLADKTFETTLTWTAGGGKDVNIPAASQAAQMIIEAEYNFVDKTVSNLNIPFALRNGSSELGRYSIQQKTTTGTISGEYFESTFNQSNDMDGRGGLVGRKGTVKILADTVAGKFWVKYVDGNTNGLKTEQYMGCGALDLKKGTAINLLNVGASGTPVGTTIALKVYPADEAAVTEFKKFKTAYKYDSELTVNGSYLDFKGTSNGNGITVADGVVNVPQDKTFSLMLTPQLQGYEGKFTVSYKLKNANADGTVVGNVFATNYGETNGATRAQVTQTNTVAFAGLSDGSSVFGGNNTSGGVLSSQMPYTLSDNAWHEYKQTIDLVNHTADYYVDGWYCGTRTLNEATKYVNQLKFVFSGCDVQIDNITVENYTDDSVKNTAKLYVADEKVTINEVEYTNYRVWASYVDVNAAADAAMSVFAASYLNGKLVNISVPTATMGELTNRSTKNAVVSGTDVDEVRGFLWRNSDLKPLTDLVKVTIPQAETSAE